MARQSRRAVARIDRNGELFIAHGAFVLKSDAMRWAEEQRKDAERGFPDDGLDQ